MTHAVSNSSHGAHEHHDDGSKTVFGFWVYLMSDLLIFSVLFATFAVLSDATAGGPTGRDLFDLEFVFVETMLLLISSFTFGMVMLNLHAGHAGKVRLWLFVTFLFGAGFIAMELYEFQHLIHQGAGPDRSAYLSAFFFLVGTHGVHVSAGLLWILIMIHQVGRYGLEPANKRRLACLSLFWHFLDIVWICVFTFVYLMGAI
ncbi:cytochrome o ubiquinol oxidase subunit III [Bordetella trematum]|uniref:Cytochrome bo(3) ubiquinol oxidase subunit 3 n=1 Tax=Bordetella trematum TaxID=123899 RepID=A0A157RM92_9BORD|nr:cytochrome o ubiquinol oxidase subunit III [Bordetella trematum]AZR93098.1 cytochrome o ubiquinol oxidase subunit III [Bordetella trematum]NNH19352.1 cytochrome o ubiquinol oxidase subunit III [Bordetella trematum]QIM71700.1 cytochrome o ubiquinol oxidase subunit III [Bordetella trematum]SAI53669.1 cytochrome O ubiquinol oxidase subunit III [Bordetella trematum]SAI59120.1 cytochrome O ubiquinol oxidase subunit III [Bordetella trematum]